MADPDNTVPPPAPGAPGPVMAPAPPVAPGAPALFVPATGHRHLFFDAFYLGNRNTAVAKTTNPRSTFYDRYNRFVGAPPSDSTLKTASEELSEKNPLNDSAVATILPQQFEDLSTRDALVRQHFDEKRTYFIFAPQKLVEAAAKATPEHKASAKVTLFFGVGVEVNLFGLCDFFASSDDSVLVTVPGVEKWSGYGQVPWGIGITTAMIRTLFDSVPLENVDFNVHVMAGYSTGYRGVNLTVINKLVDLSALERLVYFDAFYRHNDHPLAPRTSKYFKNATRWAVDTALSASGAAQVVIYGVTGGGTPRQGGDHQPTGPLKEMLADHGAKIVFADLEFPRDKKRAVMDDLEKVCLSRFIQGGIDDYFQDSAVPSDVLDFINVLPSRGSFGTLGRAGFTDLYTWIKTKPQSNLLAGFMPGHARRLVAAHDLLSGWTAKPSPGSTVLSWYEMRHREFVQEIGKEALLP
jgi:hypothetical protein